jgi:hypothetical protein
MRKSATIGHTEDYCLQSRSLYRSVINSKERLLGTCRHSYNIFMKTYYQRWASNLFYSLQIANAQIRGLISLSQIRKFLRCASPQIANRKTALYVIFFLF